MKLLVICGVVALPLPAFAQGPDDFTIATWRYFCAATLRHPNSDACVADLSGRATPTPSRQTRSYVIAEPSAPRGDHETQIASIRERLWPLGDDVVFLPGHGPTSTFGDERKHNPFVGDAVFG